LDTATTLTYNTQLYSKVFFSVVLDVIVTILSNYTPNTTSRKCTIGTNGQTKMSFVRTVVNSIPEALRLSVAEC
jgi:hypothetical protein